MSELEATYWKQQFRERYHKIICFLLRDIVRPMSSLRNSKQPHTKISVSVACGYILGSQRKKCAPRHTQAYSGLT